MNQTPKKRNYKRFSVKEIETALNMLRLNTVDETSKVTKVTRQTLYTWARRYKIKIKKVRDIIEERL